MQVIQLVRDVEQHCVGEQPDGVDGVRDGLLGATAEDAAHLGPPIQFIDRVLDSAVMPQRQVRMVSTCCDKFQQSWCELCRRP